MAIPEAQFEQLVDSIKEEVMAGVREEIAKLPASSGSGMSTAMMTAAFAEMSDALLEAVRQELQGFKAQLLSELTSQAPTSPLTEIPSNPPKEKGKLRSYW